MTKPEQILSIEKLNKYYTTVLICESALLLQIIDVSVSTDGFAV